MCCRVVLLPATVEHLALLSIAGFTPSTATSWVREIAAEKTKVTANYSDSSISFSLWPSVTNYQQHAQKRQAAGLMFQAATLLAEKTGGVLTQQSTVTGCTDDHASIQIIAQYPEQVLTWAKVCKGFREVFLQEAGLEPSGPPQTPPDEYGDAGIFP